MSLMRPCGADGETAFINCKMDDITDTGRDKWDGRENSCRAAEFGSTDADGKPIDLSKRSPWVKKLTAEAAAEYTAQKILKGWDPATPALSKQIFPSGNLW